MLVRLCIHLDAYLVMCYGLWSDLANYVCWFEYDMECGMAGTSFWLRTLVSELYYSGLLCIYMFPFMWVIYERLQIVCGRLITDVSGSLIIHFECEQVILLLISLWPPTLWTGSPDYVGLTTQNGDTCLRVNYILLHLVSFGIMLYVLSCHYLYRCSYDLT